MSHYVIVSGLPQNVKKQKIVNCFKYYIFKKQPLQFWIESMRLGLDNNLNDMLIRFETEADANTAARTLQDFPYQHTDQEIYHLKCWLKNNSFNNNMNTEELAEVKIEREIKPVEFQRPYSPFRERDRSPHLRQELTKLELEIELTNKKRMLLEAEQNLLLEQKRLEMLQKSGTFDVSFEEPTQSTQVPISIPLIELPIKQERKRLRGRNSTPREPPSMHLYWPCKILIKDMRTLIRSHINADEIPLFNSLLRNVVKKRLSDLLGCNPNHNTKKCLSMYRKLYPKNMDKDLIANLKNRILQGQLPPELLQPGTSNANMTNSSNSIDPADLPISELRKDLDDWTEDAETSQT